MIKEIVILSLLNLANGEQANLQLGIVTGQMFKHQTDVFGELTLDYKQWTFSTGLIGGNSLTDVSSITHDIMEKCIREYCLKTAVGVAYVNNSPFVGQWNYRSGIEVRRGNLSLGSDHISSNSIYDPNNGLDRVYFKVYF
jgi:hypothetical protein